MVLCFATPIVLASAFGVIFDRPAEQAVRNKLALLVVVEDDTASTRSMIAALQANDKIEVRLIDRANAEKEIAQRSSSVAVIIPKGWGNVETAASIVLLHHPLAQMESHWAEGVLTETVVKQKAAELLAPFNFSMNKPFEIERRALPEENVHPFNSRSHSFSGMTLQYLLFWGMECGLLLLRERERGIWMRVAQPPSR